MDKKRNPVFISYSRKDLRQVVALRDEIKEKLGVDCWIDITGIGTGEQFVNIIVQAIDEASVVLFMVSRSSMASDYTKKEVMYARNARKRVIPVILDDSSLSGWFLFEFGLVDYVNIHDATQKQKLFDNLGAWLGSDPVDFFEVGQHYYLKNDYDLAFEWLLKAARLDYPEAQYYVGQCYHHGRGVAVDYGEALSWYRKAAEQGSADAQFSIGILYKLGLGVEKDDVTAMEWYRKAAAKGHMLSQYEIGKCYYFGRGVPVDYEEAVKWYRKMAEQGLVHAQSSLGYCYLVGEGVEQDYEKAVYWLEKSADGDRRPGAQYHLGKCYYYGWGVTQDYAKAVYWFDRASRMNHSASEYYLGLCYLNGQGVPKDPAEARVRFRKALKQGFDAAKEYL